MRSANTGNPLFHRVVGVARCRGSACSCGCGVVARLRCGRRGRGYFGLGRFGHLAPGGCERYRHDMVLYGVADLTNKAYAVVEWFPTHERALQKIDVMLGDEPSWEGSPRSRLPL